jgi:hypothetical protein
MMEQQRDPLRGVFDNLVNMRQPTAAQTESARLKLVAVIQPQPARSRPRFRRTIPAIAVVVAALAIALVAVAPWNRSPAEAFLGEIAEAARVIPPQELPEGAYVYFTTDQLVLTGVDVPIPDSEVDIDYLLPQRIETWWQDGTEQTTTTVGRPIFFSPEDEATYYDNGLDKNDAVGESRTLTLTGIVNEAGETDWSTDPDRLRIQMRDAAEADHFQAPLDVRTVDLAAEILDPRLVAPPALRAAVLDVLATLDLDQRQLDGGGVSASVTYEDHYYGTAILELIFDGEGHLVGRRETTTTGSIDGVVPPGTTTTDITYSPPAIVSAPGIRP